MPNEPNGQMLTKDEQFKAVAQILAVGLQRLIDDRRERKARPATTTDESQPPEPPSDSEVPRTTKRATRTEYPPIDVQIEAKAREICRQCRLPATELDDLRQSIHVDLLKRQHLYDPQRASRERFAKVVIDSWAAMYVRDRQRLKRAGSNRTRPLCGLLSSEIPAPMVDPRDQVDRRDAIAYALMTLPEEWLRVIKVVLANGRAAAAREFGTSRRQIDNVMRGARHHFEAAGLSSCDLA
jgi:hypothetical protein